MTLDKITADDFESNRELPFLAQIGEHTLEFRVHQIRQGKAPPPGVSLRTPFAVILRAPETPPLEQGIVALNHPRLGLLELFIVPVAQAGGWRDYEACFN